MGNDIENRLESVFSDAEKVVEFQSVSFRELDDKAKYWLTWSLPGLLGLSGYVIRTNEELSEIFISVFAAVGISLFLAILAFAKTLGSARVESGILLPPNRKIDLEDHLLSTDEGWSSLKEMRMNEMLKAVRTLEDANAKKSKWLKVGERILFRDLLFAAIGAGAAAFFYTTSSPLGGNGPGSSSFSLLPTGTAGIDLSATVGIGIFAAATVLTISHFWDLRRKSRFKS